MLLFLCQSIVAQNKTPTNDSPRQTDLGIFDLPPLSEQCGASSIMKGGTTSSVTIPISDGDIGYCHMRSSRIISPISKPTPCYAQTSPSYVPCFISMARTHYSLPYLPIMSDHTKY